MTSGGPVSVGTSENTTSLQNGEKIKTTELINVSTGKGGAVSVSKTYNNSKETLISKFFNKIIDFFDDKNDK